MLHDNGESHKDGLAPQVCQVHIAGHNHQRSHEVGHGGGRYGIRRKFETSTAVAEGSVIVSV